MSLVISQHTTFIALFKLTGTVTVDIHILFISFYACSSKAVLELIEKNYRIHCSLNEIVSTWVEYLVLWIAKNHCDELSCVYTSIQRLKNVN